MYNQDTLSESVLRIRRPLCNGKSLCLLLPWLGTLALLLLVGGWADFSTRTAALFGLGFFISAVVTLRYFASTRAWSPAVVFLLVLGVFHLGLTPFWIWDIDPYPDLSPSAKAWFFGPAARDALYYVTHGIAGYTVGCLVGMNRLLAKAACDEPQQSHVGSDRLRRSFSNAGALVLIGAVGSWFISALQSGGLSLLFGSYSSFLAETRHLEFGLRYHFIALGLGLLVLAPVDRWLCRLAVCAYLLFAVFAFFLGLRGEVLYPLALAVSVVAFRRPMPRPWIAAGGAILLLFFINAAREIRQEGIASSTFDWSEASPINALREMGGSIRIVATSVKWHDYSAEQFREGATYLGVISRFFESLFSPHTRPPAASDFRLMNVEVAARIGPAGGSIIGEAHHNFSTLGVAVVMLVVGLIFGFFSKQNQSVMRLAFYVVIAAPLLGHVRNSFVPVIPGIVYGALVIVFVLFLVQLRQPKSLAQRSFV